MISSVHISIKKYFAKLLDSNNVELSTKQKKKTKRMIFFFFDSLHIFINMLKLQCGIK
jgi:hypothetical protein